MFLYLGTVLIILRIKLVLQQQQIVQKKKKRVKDPNAPKKPLSGYMLYCKQMRQQVTDENPELKSKEIVSKIASMWRELSDEEKAQFKV